MKKLWATGLAVAVLISVAAPAHAWCCRKSSCYEPCCEMAVTWVEKEVTCWKTVTKEREVKCVVNKMLTKEVETVHKCTVMVPEWKEEKRTCVEYRSVPKVVEKDVTCVRCVPVMVKDSCGNCCTSYKHETYVQKVKYTVCELVAEPKEYMVKVCSWKPEERTYKVKHLVCEWKPETVTCKQVYCEQVPYTTKVKVAVCTPVVPACCK